MMLRTPALLPLMLALALGVAACDDDRLSGKILGRWEIQDPGGALAGGSVDFTKDGRITIVERQRTRTGIRRKVLRGTYDFTEENVARVQVAEAGGPPVTRDIRIGLKDGWLILHFGRNQLLYRRPR